MPPRLNPAFQKADMKSSSLFLNRQRYNVIENKDVINKSKTYSILYPNVYSSFTKFMMIVLKWKKISLVPIQLRFSKLYSRSIAHHYIVVRGYETRPDFL